MHLATWVRVKSVDGANKRVLVELFDEGAQQQGKRASKRVSWKGDAAQHQRSGEDDASRHVGTTTKNERDF